MATSPSDDAPGATELSDEEKRQHLKELMSQFDTAMLVTRTSDGSLRSRPLSIAGHRPDGGIIFAIGIDSPKVHELEADAHVCVVMQDKRRFVSLSGTAHLVTDRALIAEFWSEAWKVWFPKGKDDPSLCLLVVEPTEAGYWDGTGLAGLRYLFEAAKAYVTGTRPASDHDGRQTSRIGL